MITARAAIVSLAASAGDGRHEPGVAGVSPGMVSEADIQGHHLVMDLHLRVCLHRLSQQLGNWPVQRRHCGTATATQGGR